MKYTFRNLTKIASDDERGDLRGLDTMTLEKILITCSRHWLGMVDTSMDQQSAEEDTRKHNSTLFDASRVQKTKRYSSRVQ